MNINGVDGRQQPRDQQKKQPQESRLNGPQPHQQQPMFCRSPTAPSTPVLTTDVNRLTSTLTSSCVPFTNSFTEVSKSTAPTAFTSGSAYIEDLLSFEEQQLQCPAYYDGVAFQKRPEESYIDVSATSASPNLPVSDSTNIAVAQRKGMVRREFGRRVLWLKRKKSNQKNASKESKGSATTTRNKLFSFPNKPRAAPRIVKIERRDKSILKLLHY